MEALYWHIKGKRLRARNRLRIGAAQSPHAYRLWMSSVEKQRQTIAEAPGNIAGWPTRPRISVILFQHPDLRQGQIQRAFDALSAQCYPDWELVLVQSHETPAPRAMGVPRLTLAPGRVDDLAQALALGANVARGDYLLAMPVDAVLAPTALYRFVEALQDHPEATILYGDHDHLDHRNHRCRPWFKPEWNAEMFLAQDYISQACLIRAEAARAALPIPLGEVDAAIYSMALSVAMQPGASIIHLPHILTSIGGADGPATQRARAAGVARHLADSGAVVRRGDHGTIILDYPLPAPPPLVSIIIPTRNRVDLLARAVSGVLDATAYAPIELLIIDNGSTERATLDYLAQIGSDTRVRVLRWDHPFNYAAINNFAAAPARGDYLCLLNNDVEIIDADWLAALMRHAVREGVGAVGAKLLYDDGTIQHAGVVVGLGDAAGHAHRFDRGDAPGYFAQSHICRQVSAVTGACLVVERRKYEAVGGLDEANFAVAFNDVDLCLKLQEAGYRNIYVGQAKLIHHESRSRERDCAPAQIERYRSELAALQTRWNTRRFADPSHHPQLDRASERYLIRL